MELSNDFRVALPVEQTWAVLTDVERIAPCLPGAQLQEIEGDEYRGIVKVKVGPMTAQYKGKATFVEQDDAGYVAVLRAEGKESRGQGTANATITARLTPDGDGTAVSVHTDLTITGRVAQFGRGVLVDVSAKLLEQFSDNLAATIATGGAAPSGATTPVEGLAEEAAPAEAPSEEPGAAAAETAASAAGSAAETAASSAGSPMESTVEVPAVEPAAAVPTPGPAAAGAVAAPERPAVRRVSGPEPEPIDLIGTAGAPIAQRVAPILVFLALLWLLRRLFGHRDG